MLQFKSESGNNPSVNHNNLEILTHISFSFKAYYITPLKTIEYTRKIKVADLSPIHFWKLSAKKKVPTSWIFTKCWCLKPGSQGALIQGPASTTLEIDAWGVARSTSHPAKVNYDPDIAGGQRGF